MSAESLFKPFEFKGLRLPNRIVMAPMTRSFSPGGVATEDELRALVRERLAAFKVPVEVRFWPETLPRNANGKIVKTELKKLFEAQA